MDQHPIPQNVTGFQFKLVGSMTVKQFAYVTAGVITAFILYYLPLKGALGTLLKLLLIPLFGSSGIIVAFIPVDGRPIDILVGNFMQALFSPNQYVYRKGVRKFSFSTIVLHKTAPATHKDTLIHHVNPAKQKALNAKGMELQKILIKSATSKIKTALDEREAAFLSSIPLNPAVPTPPSSVLQQAQAPFPVPTLQPVTIPKAPDTYQSPIASGEEISDPNPPLESEKKQEATENDSKIKADLETQQKALDIQNQTQNAIVEKQRLEQEIVKLKEQLSARTVAPSVTQIKQPLPQDSGVDKTKLAHVRNMPREMNKNMGIFVSDTPNVVTGTVKDSRGNILPNILVEIKDKEGNPARAFKTNALGNFASASPLAVGAYTITLEDPKKQHTFDSIQITANNQVMLPLEITSYDKREELRKELFS